MVWYTVAETEVFASDAKSIWAEEERLEFIGWIAANPLAGDVIPGSGGCRKVRWARSGMGKRGGGAGDLFQPAGKRRDLAVGDLRQGLRRNIPAHLLKAIKEELDHD